MVCVFANLTSRTLQEEKYYSYPLFWCCRPLPPLSCNVLCNGGAAWVYLHGLQIWRLWCYMKTIISADRCLRCLVTLTAAEEQRVYFYWLQIWHLRHYKETIIRIHCVDVVDCCRYCFCASNNMEAAWPFYLFIFSHGGGGNLDIL